MVLAVLWLGSWCVEMTRTGRFLSILYSLTHLITTTSLFQDKTSMQGELVLYEC